MTKFIEKVISEVKNIYKDRYIDISDNSYNKARVQ